MKNKSKLNIKYIIGIDEAGRGPIAGPVAVGAVLLSSKRIKKFNYIFKGVKDSKKLTERQREKWCDIINNAQKDGIVDYAVSLQFSKTIDRYGINIAINRGIKNSLELIGADPKKCHIFLDGGIKAPKEFEYQKTIVHGDQKIKVISIASIVAKVSRDQFMKKMAKKYLFYGLESNKGYGSAHHIHQIAKHGLSKIHRKSYKIKQFSKSNSK